jgi:hypothetical protein
MNTNNFKIFIEALEALPQDIKDRQVAINDFEHFYNKPTAKIRTNDFGGLIYITSKDIKGLPQLYKKTRKELDACTGGYCSTIWIWTLGEFLDTSFPGWAHENKIIWGNNFGAYVGQYNRAFGKKEDETLTNNDIIIYLRGVFERHIKSEGATK